MFLTQKLTESYFSTVVNQINPPTSVGLGPYPRVACKTERDEPIAFEKGRCLLQTGTSEGTDFS